MSYSTMITALKAREAVVAIEPRFADYTLEEMRRCVAKGSIESKLTQAVVAYSVAFEDHTQDEFPDTPVAQDLNMCVSFGV